MPCGRKPSRSWNELVGARGLEPPTSASRTLRATRLRYAPTLPIIGGFNFESKRCKLKSVFVMDRTTK